MEVFSTEVGDTLRVNGADYSGTQGPQGVVPEGSILWSSDARRCGGGGVFLQNSIAGLDGSMGSRGYTSTWLLGFCA